MQKIRRYKRSDELYRERRLKNRIDAEGRAARIEWERQREERIEAHRRRVEQECPDAERS